MHDTSCSAIISHNLNALSPAATNKPNQHMKHISLSVMDSLSEQNHRSSADADSATSKPSVNNDTPSYPEGHLICVNKLPHYTEPKVISGKASLPSIFFAYDVLKKLTGEYFVQTYSYFKYFDSTQ